MRSGLYRKAATGSQIVRRRHLRDTVLKWEETENKWIWGWLLLSLPLETAFKNRNKQTCVVTFKTSLTFLRACHPVTLLFNSVFSVFLTIVFSQCFLFQGCWIWWNQTWDPDWSRLSLCQLFLPATHWINSWELFKRRVFKFSFQVWGQFKGAMCGEQRHRSPVWLGVLCCSTTQSANWTHWAIWVKSIRNWKWLFPFPGSAATGNLKEAAVVRRNFLYCIFLWNCRDIM